MIARELIKVTLSYLVMKLLQKKGRMYGYEITQVLDEVSAGQVKLTFAALYPVLHKLEAEGLVQTETENVNNRTRKYYTLTDSGNKKAKLLLDEFNDYLSQMQSLINN